MQKILIQRPSSSLIFQSHLTTQAEGPLIDQLSSINCHLDHFPENEHHGSEHNYDICKVQENPYGLTFNALEDYFKQEEEVHLFNKLSENFKEESISQKAKVEKNKTRKLQNDTKNIPKNFGKGIINFIQKNEKKIRHIVAQSGLSFTELIKIIKPYKKTINTIAELRMLWTDQYIGKSLRIISNLFFRKYSLQYIFNSRISCYSTHIKYRRILWEALKNPEDFDHIKEY